MSDILPFLRDLAHNNNREWFEHNRTRYEAARQDLMARVSELLSEMPRLDPRFSMVEAKQCLFRINRDTRFSADKSPYKRHFGVYLTVYDKADEQGGYYMHFEPGNCFVAAGAYCLSPRSRLAVRQHIVDEVETLHAITTQAPFSTLYMPQGIGQERLKTLPKGFDKAFPYPEYLRPQDYSVWHPVSDAFFFTTDWVEQTLRSFAVAKPFLDFINAAIDEMA
ncbi:MAG: DUF2461 domain-containing protein [Bacteroidales bacterium]|nr:DUF2461 domain-containing protein [Bacteroidales bacterium]